MVNFTQFLTITFNFTKNNGVNRVQNRDTSWIYDKTVCVYSSLDNFTLPPVAMVVTLRMFEATFEKPWNLKGLTQR